MSKFFDGVRALDSVGLELRTGEVHAVVGENGAGKSTLIRILAGLESPDGGRIVLDGEPLRFASSVDSRVAGIAVIHQDFDLPPNLPVIDSLLLGQEPQSRFGFVRRRHRRQVARQCLDRMGLPVPLETLTGDLSATERQLLAVARAVLQDARVLIMDEPTSALAAEDARRLLDLVGQLGRHGMSVLFVSHKLHEVFSIADRISVLRDGRSVGSWKTSETSEAGIVSLMVGRELAVAMPASSPREGKELLKVTDLNRAGRYREVSFSLTKGEILGIYGLKGSGRSALLRGLFGIEMPISGEVRIEGQAVRLRKPMDAIRRGIAMVPEDRKQQALFSNMDCGENLSLAALGDLQRFGLIDRSAERSLVESMMSELGVRASGPTQPIAELSGGNQQKIVLGRWLVKRPHLLLLNEPTAGIDVGARADLYSLINQLASGGMGIILVTSDLPEMLAACGRLLVMAEGEIVAEFSCAAASEEAVMLAIQQRKDPALSRLQA